MIKRNKSDTAYLKELGARIAQIRTDKRLSQVELGNKVDMEKPTINRLEKGNTNPTALTLRKICKALDIPVSRLFED